MTRNTKNKAGPEPGPGKRRASTRFSPGSGNQPGPGGVWSDRQGETVAPETGGGPWHLAIGTTPQSLGEEAEQILPYMLGPQEVWGTLAKVPHPSPQASLFPSLASEEVREIIPTISFFTQLWLRKETSHQA